MDPEVHSFGILDYIAFSSVIIVSTVTGLYHAFAGGGQKSTSKFLMADRKMHCLPVAISVKVSYLSAISLLGIPSEIFVHGVQICTIIFSFFIALPITAFIFIPIFHGLNITSAYEYLEKRYNKTLRSVGAAVFIIQTCFYLAVVSYAPALALEAVTKFAVWKTILITGCICALYTSLGGIKAVIWTDVFQFIVLYCSLITVVVMGSIHAGGINHVWQYNLENDHINFFNFDVNPTVRLSFWSLVIGGTFNVLSVWAINQISVQRFLTAKSKEEAAKSVLINLPANIVSFFMFALIGIILFAYYGHPYPISFENVTATPFEYNTTMSNDISTNFYHHVPNYDSPDQVLIYFVSLELGKIPGIQGIFVSCLFAGTLSTLSSGLNALATVTLVDIIRPIRNRRINGANPLSSPNGDYYDTVLSKFMTAAYGGTVIGLAFLSSLIGSLIEAAHTVFGASGGPLLAVFSLGIFFRRSNSWGVLMGLLIGFGLAIWVVTSGLLNKDPSTGLIPEDVFPLYRISFMWYSAASFTATLILGLIASELFRLCNKSERNKEVDPSLMAPFLRPKTLWKFNGERNQDVIIDNFQMDHQERESLIPFDDTLADQEDRKSDDSEDTF